MDLRNTLALGLICNYMVLAVLGFLAEGSLLAILTVILFVYRLRLFFNKEAPLKSVTVASGIFLNLVFLLLGLFLTWAGYYQSNVIIGGLGIMLSVVSSFTVLLTILQKTRVSP